MTNVTVRLMLRSDDSDQGLQVLDEYSNEHGGGRINSSDISNGFVDYIWPLEETSTIVKETADIIARLKAKGMEEFYFDNVSITILQVGLST